MAQKREEAVAREVMKKIADDKKMNKKEKDERYDLHCINRLKKERKNVNIFLSLSLYIYFGYSKKLSH